MSKQWYVSKDDNQLDGSFTYRQVKGMMGEHPDSQFLVWMEGMVDWSDPDKLDSFQVQKNLITGVGKQGAREMFKIVEAEDWTSYFRDGNVLAKHLVVAGLGAILMQVGIWGLSFANIGQWTVNNILTWLFTLLFHFVIIYFILGRAIHGFWPHLGLVQKITRLILGPTRSLRRRLTYSSLFGSPTFIALFLLPIPASLGMAFLSFALIWFLLGFYTRWETTNTTCSTLLPGFECGAFSMRRKVLDAFEQEEFPGLVAEEIHYVEADESNSMGGFGSDGEAERVLQFTINRARVVLKIQDQGDFIFIRWESFISMAHRRIWLLILMCYDFLDHLVSRWLGTSLERTRQSLLKILFDWNGRNSMGNSPAQNYDFDTFGKTGHVPSNVVDRLFLLQEATKYLIQETVAEVAREENREVPKMPVFEFLDRRPLI